MKFDWSRFTEDSFRAMRKIIVDSRMDNYFTEGKLGVVLCDGLEAYLRLQEEADEEFSILLSYRTPAGETVEGGSLRYDSDCLYFEFREIVEARIQADVKKDPRLAAGAGQDGEKA